MAKLPIATQPGKRVGSVKNEIFKAGLDCVHSLFNRLTDTVFAVDLDNTRLHYF